MRTHRPQETMDTLIFWPFFSLSVSCLLLENQTQDNAHISCTDPPGSIDDRTVNVYNFNEFHFGEILSSSGAGKQHNLQALDGTTVWPLQAFDD